MEIPSGCQHGVDVWVSSPEPNCRQVRQQSGSGEGVGQDRALSQRRGDFGDGEQDQRLTATVTATATGYQQRPAASGSA